MIQQDFLSRASSISVNSTHEGPWVRAGTTELSLREVKPWILHTHNIDMKGNINAHAIDNSKQTHHPFTNVSWSLPIQSPMQDFD